MDSCGDHLTAAQMDKKWSGFNNGGVASVGTTFGRNGTNGFQIASSVSPTTVPHGAIWRDVPSATTYGVAFAWRFESSFASDERALVSFRNASGEQFTIYHLSDGTIQARVATTSLGISVLSFSHTTMRHLEVRGFVNNTTGTIQVRVDGAIVLNLSGLDSQGQVTDTITQIRVSNGATHASNVTASIEMWIDDFVIWDTTGSVNNTFLGDCRVVALLPDGAGASAQFTPNGAATPHECVDDATPDDDTTYAASATVGQIDSHTFGGLPATASVVKAVAVNIWARKDDAGTRELRTKTRLAGTYGNGASIAMATTYANYQQLFETDPASAAWTPANVNSMEGGYEVTV